MSNYRAIVHYYFKKGMEEQGIKFLQNELLNKAKQYGCHGIEFLQNEKDHSQVVGIAQWNDIQDARRFQELWVHKEKELMRYCTKTPEREFMKVRGVHVEKLKKAA